MDTTRYEIVESRSKRRSARENAGGGVVVHAMIACDLRDDLLPPNLFFYLV